MKMTKIFKTTYKKFINGYVYIEKIILIFLIIDGM